MKRIIILIVSLFKITICFSQIILTHQQMIQPDDSIYIKYLDTTGFTSGDQGANVLWDYSNINVFGNDAILRNYIHTSHAVCFSDTVNMVISSDFYSLPSYSNSYYFSDSTQYIYKGFCDYNAPFTSGEQSFTDPILLMPLPFKYLDSFSDSYIGNARGEGSLIKIWQTTGTITKHYDAFGELRLPWVTLPNTARIQMTEFSKDTLINSTTGGGDVRIQSQTGFEWYDLNSHGTVLLYYDNTITKIPYNGTITKTTRKTFYGKSNATVGIVDIFSPVSSFKIFPNPSTGLINLDIPLQLINDNSLKLLVYDFSGRIIINKKIYINSKIFKLDLSDKTKGLYCVSLGNGKELFTSTLIIN